MPLRVANTVERNVVCQPLPLVVLAATVAQDVLPSVVKEIGEWAGRYVQNVGANDAYYAFGHDCDPTNFNGVLMKASNVDANGYGSGQQLDVSNCAQRVSMYSVSGTTIAVTVLKRNDNEQGSGGILSPVLGVHS